jgi:anaerobic selenocysteine-containing dehydrogenase
MLYGPTRIKFPMKRAGERGEGKWEKISWSEALTLLSEKLGEIRDKGEAHTVAAISGAGYGTVPALMKRFMTAYGSPNCFRSPSMQDVDEFALHSRFRK